MIQTTAHVEKHKSLTSDMIEDLSLAWQTPIFRMHRWQERANRKENCHWTQAAVDQAEERHDAAVIGFVGVELQECGMAGEKVVWKPPATNKKASDREKSRDAAKPMIADPKPAARKKSS